MTNNFKIKSFATPSAFDPNEINKSKIGGVNDNLSWTDVYNLYEDASVSLYNSISGTVCSGFFIDYADPNGNLGYIVSSAHCVLSSNRETRQTIYGTVYNVNKTGKDIVYRLKIIGVDASNDIAVLHPVEDAAPYDTYIDLNKQTHFSFGDSRKTRIGSEIAVLGNPEGIEQQSFTVGVVRDNIHTVPNGVQPCEAIMTDSSVSGGNSGSPIITKTGHVVGILGFSYTGTVEQINGGPAQYVVQPIVQRIIDGLGSSSMWTDVNGDYVKGFLGIHFNAIFPYNVINWGGVGTWTRKGVYVDTAQNPGNILLNKILVSINDITVGDVEGQIAPGSITNFILPSTDVKVVYIDPADLTTEIETTITLLDFPAVNDAPLSLGNNL